MAVVAIIIAVNCSGPDQVSTGGSVELQLSYSGDRAEANFALVERLTRECMASEGFRYDERVLDAVDYGPVPTIGSWTLEKANEIGFGVTTSLQGDFDENIVEDDANRKATDAMTGAEFDAWFEALRGPAEDPRSGCRNLAKAEANGDWFEQTEPIRRDYNEMWDRFQADPAIVVLEQQWADCFAARGFGRYPRFSALVDSFGPIVQSLNPSNDEAVQSATSDEIAKAQAAVNCATPLRDDWNKTWDLYQIDFLTNVDIPKLPT